MRAFVCVRFAAYHKDDRAIIKIKCTHVHTIVNFSVWWWCLIIMTDFFPFRCGQFNHSFHQVNIFARCGESLSDFFFDFFHQRQSIVLSKIKKYEIAYLYIDNFRKIERREDTHIRTHSNGINTSNCRFFFIFEN